MDVVTTTEYASKFCDSCDNLMFVQSQADRSVYKCRNKACSHTEEIGSDTRVVAVVRTYGTKARCIGDTERSPDGEDPESDEMLQNPTLPHIAIKCPAPSCDGAEAVVKRVDHTNMVFKYVCVKCRRSWMNRV